MRQFTITAAAIMAFATLCAAVPAQAEMNGGGPLRKGDQCFHYSSRADETYGRFGYWSACPQVASAVTTVSTTTTIRARRRHAASR